MRRRDFLHALAGTTAGLWPSSVAHAGPPPSAAPRSAADLELVLRAASERVRVLGETATEVWRYSGKVSQGPRGALENSDSGYLGPTLRVSRGQRVRVQFENALAESSIVHWHGLHVAQENDGHPSYAVAPGGRYTYDFEVQNRAGTYWYHAHPDARTGPQVYRGLAGLLLVTDSDEQRLALPDGDRELPLVLQDRTFDAADQLVYAPNAMVGFLGDQVLVNGLPARTRQVQRGPHRLRLLNGSNSRIYDLAWSDGSAVTVLGTDGGLLAAPSERTHVVLAPGQRLDIWANFGSGPGDDVWLESKAFDAAGPAMMRGGPMRGGGRGLANGAALRLQHFSASGPRSAARPPPKLASPSALALAPAGSGLVKSFPVQMAMMRWTLNGRPFEMSAVSDNERVQLGAVEDWEFSSSSGPMAMPHPIHLHGSQFQIVQRKHGPGARALREGLFDQGWLDTFLLLPGDRVRIRKRFDRYPGLFLYHCHNLEHEDMGMMRNFFVER